jgi:gamma-glutamylcyclotransferase (GGCT)/AIG2-like uncharacterized protein YtfP
MPELVFFYGTLMTPFHRTARLRIDDHLTYRGTGTIEALLFDLGIYPAAVPLSGGCVRGELYEIAHPTIVLGALDQLEGYSPGEPESSLYTRMRTDVRLESGKSIRAWAYFYNAPLGRAEKIESGDYLEYLKVR